MTVPIAIQLDQAESTVTVTSILRGDNNVAPAAITLPVSLTVGTPVGGQYPWTASFTTTDPTAPPFYYAVGLINGLLSFNFTIFGTTAPAGLWATLDMVNAIYSADNVNLWSTSRGGTVPDATMQQGAFNRADIDIMSEFTINHCVPPVTDSGALGYIEAEIVGAYLYLANGLQDSAKGMDGKIQAHLDSAWDDLDELLFMNRGGYARIDGYSDAPLGAGATVDPSGNPVEICPPWPVPRWTGYRYVWGGVPIIPVAYCP